MCLDASNAIDSGHTKEIYDLAWSPCGNYFITASIDNTARVWSLAESKKNTSQKKKPRPLLTIHYRGMHSHIRRSYALCARCYMGSIRSICGHTVK